jgi:hypothetical protein
MFLLYTLWKFNELGDAIPTTIDEHRKVCPQITIQDGPSKSEIIFHQKETLEIHMTLGCDKNMIHDCSKHKHKLKNKCDRIGINIKNSKFNRKQGWMSLNGSFIPSIKYSLPAMSFPRDEIDKIHKFTFNKFLSNLGYDHSMH